MAAPSHAPPRPTDDPLARGLIVGALLANTVFQKLAIPGTGGALPLSLLLTTFLVGAGLVLGRLIPVAVVGVGLALTAGVLIACAGLSPGRHFSMNALALLIVLLMPYAVALRPGALDPGYPARVFTGLAALFAALGVVQFFAQFVVGADIAFYLDRSLPPDLLLANFNNLNELSYGAGVYKANGVFLLEAAFLNQLLCLAVLVELLGARRLLRLALYGAGIMVTYSGTGLLLLAAILPAYILHQRYLGLAAAGAITAVLFVLLAESLGLGTFLDRADEFSSDQSSAFARFFSIFYLLRDYAWLDWTSVLVGRGPGSVSEQFNSVGYAAFDPSWGKVMYEYGVIGFVAYFAFLGACLWRARGSGYLKAALLLQFMFLGGYVATTPVHIEFWTLLVWPTLAGAAARRASLGRRPAPVAQAA